jgi:hypothetical protein
MSELLPDAPAGFREFPTTRKKPSLLYWLNPKVTWRLGKSERRVWVSEQPDNPIKLIDMAIQPFASEQFAHHFWRYQAPDPEVLASLLDPPAETESIDSQGLVIRWRRGAGLLH